MNIYNAILDALESIKSDIKFYEEKLSKLPEGSLSTSKRSNGIACFQNMKGEKRYIPAAEKQLASDLAKKSFLKRKLKDAQKEEQALTMYLKHHAEPTAEKFLANNERIRNLVQLSEFAVTPDDSIGINLLKNPKWLNKVASDPVGYKILCDHTVKEDDGSLKWDYNGSDKAPKQECRDTKTICGIYVRSKSEAIITDAMYHSGLLFVYEPQLMINGKYYYPDFLVFHPVRGIMIIVEHGGMFFDKNNNSKYDDNDLQNALSYTQAFSNKLRDYMKNGWAPGVNLFITGETKYKHFNPSDFDVLMKTYLLE